jgi:ADP-ribose pyrophosphatase
MQAWKTLKKILILDHNKFLQVEQHTIELSDGKIIHDWPWVVSPDYALVLPVTARKTLLLFRQTKYAVAGTSLAPVGGYLEPGEDPLLAAKRELREEMGCEAPEWISLGSYPNDGNHGGGYGHLFIALNVQKVGDPIVDDLEEMELHEYSLEQMKEYLFQKEVKVLGWAAMIAMGLLYLERHFKE